VSDSDTTALVRARGVGRPSIAAASTETIARWLEEDRALPSGEIVRRLQQEYGYRGGKSAVYELIRRLRPVSVAPLVRQSCGVTTGVHAHGATARHGGAASRKRRERLRQHERGDDLAR